MKCYILRWNPNISSYTKENHSFCIKSALNGESFKFNWSIKEWESVEEGDFFILQQVGTEQDGIAAFGQFTGNPYESRSWRKDGTKLYYSDLFVWAFIDRDLCNKFPADKMEKICPEINWHGGPSGILISESEAEKIYLELFTQLMGNLGPNPAIAFDTSYDFNLQEKLLDYFDVMAPEYVKAFYEKQDCICENCGKVINPKPSFEEIRIFWKSDKEDIRHYPVNPTLKDLENYLTLNGYCLQCDIDMEDGVSYPHIENHEAITKHFNNCVTWFHDDYITDVLIQKNYVELKIHATGADTEDWENVKPCNVIIECHGVVKMEEIDPGEFKVQPLYELQTIQVNNLYKLLLNGCGGTITCRKLVARVEEEIAEEKSDQKKGKIKKAKKSKKTESNKLDNVSMVGRIAYLIMCCEAYLKSMFPDRDWSFVAKNMWNVTSSRYWENWSDKYVGFIPSVLFDYKKYDKEDLEECYTEEDFEFLKSLYSGLTEGKEDDPDDEFADIITKPFDFVMAYEGTSIGDGSEGFSLIEETENILTAHNIPLPDYHRVEFSTFKQFHGWGNEFDGTKLSVILNK